MAKSDAVLKGEGASGVPTGRMNSFGAGPDTGVSGLISDVAPRHLALTITKVGEAFSFPLLSSVQNPMVLGHSGEALVRMGCFVGSKNFIPAQRDLRLELGLTLV
jgi:hypothetical protein